MAETLAAQQMNNADIARIHDALRFYNQKFLGIEEFIEEFREEGKDACDELIRIHDSLYKALRFSESDVKNIRVINERIKKGDAGITDPDEVFLIADLKHLKIVLDYFTNSVKDPSSEKIIGAKCQERFGGLPSLTKSRAKPVAKREVAPEGVTLVPPAETAKPVEITMALREKFREIFDKARDTVMADPIKYGVRKEIPTRYIHDRFFSNAQQRGITFAIDDLKKFIKKNLDFEPYIEAMEKFFAIIK